MVYNVIKFHNDTYVRMAFFFKKDFLLWDKNGGGQNK